MDDILVQIIFYMNGIVLVGMTYYAFTCIFKATVKKRWIFLAYVAYLAVTTQVFFEFENMWINFAVNITLFLSLSFLFSGNLSSKLVFAVLIYIMSMLAEGISFLGLSAIYYIQYETGVAIGDILPLGRTVSSIIFLPLVLIIILIFRKLVNKKARYKQFKIPAQYTVAVLLMLLGIIIVNTLLISTTLDGTQTNAIQITISHIISFVVIFLIIWLYNTILNHLEEFERNRLKDQMLERWEIQYQTAVEAQKVIVELKHNLRFQLLALSNALEAGDIEKAKNYIAAEVGSFESVIASGNMSIDAMLNYYQHRIKETLGIELDTEIFVPPNMKLDAKLTVTILGNALENAVEACEYVARDKRYIHVKAVFTPECELLITITNPYSVAPLADSGGNLLTTKFEQDRHGIGLSSILEILPEDCGQIHIEYADNIFRFMLLFYDVHIENRSNIPNDASNVPNVS